MKRKLGGKQLDYTIRQLFPDQCEHPLGVEVECHEAKDAQTDEQRKGWHFLLQRWAEIDPVTTGGMEKLKTKVLLLKFGAAKVEDRHGNEALIPLRRTTQIFDWDIPGYRRKLLSKKLYTELIDFTYRLAADSGVLLPDLEDAA